MTLLTNKVLMDRGRKDGYAIGAFNINNMEILQAITSAAVEEDSPVIIATSEGAIEYAGLEMIVCMVNTIAETSKIPMSLHLDHGKDYEIAARCVDAGYTSVMIDASSLPMEENMAVTKKVVDYAHQRGVAVEAELGRLAGIEEHVSVEARDAFFTNPQDALEFVNQTGVDSLAIAIGTSHGAYKFKGDPRLDFTRLSEIASLVSIPLVLHGASGVPEDILALCQKYGAQLPGAKGVPNDSISEAVKMGVAKVNIDTDLRLSFTGAIRKILAEKPEAIDPRKILGPARELMHDVVKRKMKLLGSSGKAGNYR
jgi:fructose-bisphosphate aldolase, class II